MNDAVTSTESVRRLTEWAIEALQEKPDLDATDINALRLLERVANDIVRVKWEESLRAGAAAHAAIGSPAYASLSLDAQRATGRYTLADADATHVRVSVGYRIGL